MLLHHARRAARTTPDGALVPLAEQDRSRWDTKLISEGVEILQAPLLNRAVAVGEVDGPHAGLAALEHEDPAVPRRTAVEAYLRERAGDLALAARLYADAARAATNLTERDHLIRQAARLHEMLRK